MAASASSLIEFAAKIGLMQLFLIIAQQSVCVQSDWVPEGRLSAYSLARVSMVDCPRAVRSEVPTAVRLNHCQNTGGEQKIRTGP